jgi:GT2 family glycosyltransferase
MTSSLVITAHRPGPMLDRCLDSAARLDPQPQEIIVAIDGADQAVKQAADAHLFRVAACPLSPGVSATRNAGARATNSAMIVFADSDVSLPRDFMARAAHSFEENPEADAVIGSYDDEPAAPGIVSRYRNLLHHYTHQHGAREAQTFWAGCGAIRREAFMAVDGFDESYRQPSVEDIELGYRLRRAGYRIRLVPDWQVKHLKQWRLRDLVLTDVFRRAIPWTRLLRREGRLDNDLNLDHGARLTALLVGLAVPAFIAGFFWSAGFLVATFLLAAATMINWPFYRFLARTGGWFFAIAAIPLHWLYFLGATLGFVLGHLGPRHTARNAR